MAVVDVVARRYAQAYFDLARESGAVADLREGLGVATEALGDRRVAAALGNPRISLAEKTRRVTALLAELPAETRNLVRLLLEHDRLAALDRVLTEFDRLADRASGVVRAEVTAAVPVDGALESRIARTLSERLGGEVQTVVRYDPAILGGLVIRIGDRVIDGSVRTRLEQLQSALA